MDETESAAPAAAWAGFYGAARRNRNVYPTEWVVRVLAGGKYPGLDLDHTGFAEKRALDLSCGDGRNLGLLRDLALEVHATEISEPMVAALRARNAEMGWNAEFRGGKSHAIPYPDGFFSLVLACASCYYLEGAAAFADVLEEIRRCLEPGGWFVGSIPDPYSFIARDAVHLEDGSIAVRNDPFGLRNGTRLMIAQDRGHLESMLAPRFEAISVGHLDDDYFGLRVSGFIFACRKPADGD